MAKVVQEDRIVIVKPWWERLSILYISLVAGLSWWVITVLVNRYVVEPIACQDSSAATFCTDSFGISGSVVAVLVAVVALFTLIRLMQPRPVVIAIGAAALLWDLSTLINGLVWYEALGWSLLLYALAYGLLWFIARIPSTVASLGVAIGVVLILRLLLLL